MSARFRTHMGVAHGRPDLVSWAVPTLEVRGCWDAGQIGASIVHMIYALLSSALGRGLP
jgi:hypothetical protein